MKKLILTLMTTALFTVPTLASGDVTVYSNGNLVEDKGIIVEGRTLVPVRGVFEYMGYTVEWDNDTKTATLTSEDKSTVIALTNGEKIFTVNGEAVTPDVPQQIVEGRFMLPLRAVGETLNAEVDWDADTKTAGVTIKEENTVIEETTEETTVENNEPYIAPGVSIEVVDPSTLDDSNSIEIVIE